MTTKQANWARQHDWYYGERNSAKGIIILARDDMVSGEVRFFNNFDELYIWAGY